jgi:putative MATE family efflux protein
MGTSTLCAFALGEGNKKKAEEIFSQTVALIVVLSLVISLLVSLFARPLAFLLGAGPQTVGYASQYLHVVCLFSLCFILSYCLEVMVKVDGSPHLAVIGVGISFVVHIGLDYVFIFLLDMEVLGSALATGLAQLASVLFFLHHFLSGRSTLRFRKFKLHLGDLKRILPLGVADCSIEFMLGFLTLLYNHVILSSFGEESLPVYSVISYLSLLVAMLMQGIAQGMMPLVSLALGHKDTSSVRSYLRKTLVTVLAAGILIEALCQLAPQALVGLLLEGDSSLFLPAVSALRQYALSYLPAGISIALAGYFAALGRGSASTLLSLARGFGFLPAALLVLNALTQGSGIWMAALVGEVLSLILGLFLLRRTQKTLPVSAPS